MLSRLLFIILLSCSSVTAFAATAQIDYNPANHIDKLTNFLIVPTGINDDTKVTQAIDYQVSRVLTQAGYNEYQRVPDFLVNYSLAPKNGKQDFIIEAYDPSRVLLWRGSLTLAKWPTQSLAQREVLQKALIEILAKFPRKLDPQE